MGKENSQNRAAMTIAQTPPKKRGTVRETPVKEEFPQARSGTTTLVGSYVPPKKSSSQPMGTPSKNSWASIMDSPVRNSTTLTRHEEHESPGKGNNDGGYFRQDIQVKRTFVHYDSPKANKTISATPPKSVPHSFKPAIPGAMMLFGPHHTVTTQSVPPTPVVGQFGASPCASPMPLNRHQTSLGVQPAQTAGTTTLRLSDYLPSPVVSQGAAPQGQSLGGMACAPDFTNVQVMQAAAPSPMAGFPNVPPLPGPGFPQQCYQTCHQPQAMPVSLDLSLQQQVPQMTQPQPQPVVMDMSNMGMAIGASIAPLQQSYQLNPQYQSTQYQNCNWQQNCAPAPCMTSLQAPVMHGTSMPACTSIGQPAPYPDQNMCGVILEEPRPIAITLQNSMPSMGTQIAPAPPAGPPSVPACRRGIQGPILQVPAGQRWSDMEPHQEA